MKKEMCKCGQGNVTHEYYYGNHERVCGTCASIIACEQAPIKLKSDPVQCLEKYFQVIDDEEYITTSKQAQMQEARKK